MNLIGLWTTGPWMQQVVVTGFVVYTKNSLQIELTEGAICTSKTMFIWFYLQQST